MVVRNDASHRGLAIRPSANPACDRRTPGARRGPKVHSASVEPSAPPAMRLARDVRALGRPGDEDRPADEAKLCFADQASSGADDETQTR